MSAKPKRLWKKRTGELSVPHFSLENVSMRNSDNKIGENLEAGFKRFGLTSREIQILRCLAMGKTDRQISVDLNISVKTVNHHVSNIILKLEANNRTHAVVKALLDKHIKMRTADIPIRMLNRRIGEQSKMVRVIASNIPERASCGALG